MSLVEEICFRICRRGLHGHAGDHAPHTDLPTYAHWRDVRLQEQFNAHFLPSDVGGRRVIDFGCGSGDLSRYVAELGAASVTGIDLSPKFLTLARDEAARHPKAARLSFLIGEPATIPLADAAAEVLLCFGVMEHVIQYRAIVPEWRRVLVPGGRVLIWWSVWMHPYGHHCYPLINLPWAHLFLSGAALHRVCARLYDDPAYRPSFWHRDQDDKKPNPFRQNQTFADYLNKLTTWRFDRLCRESRLRIVRKEMVPFSGKRFKAVKRALASIPVLSDGFCSCVVYDLEAV